MKHLFLIFLLGTLAACSTDEVDTWNAKPCVWFSEASDTLVFSFYSQADDVEEYVLELPITMAGAISDADRTVAVLDKGSLHSGTEYEIVSATIPAGEVEGVLRVNVQRTGNLETEPDTITFELASSEAFELGLTAEYWTNSIVVSSLLAQPAWWNSDAESSLGYYSDLKMQVVYQVDGACDLFEQIGAGAVSWYDDEVEVMVYRLNRYCVDNDIRYDYGSSIGEIVVFDFWSE